MDIEQLKTTWQNADTPLKNQDQLWWMTKIKNNPEMQKARIQFILEFLTIVLFLAIYYNAFDGENKSLWANIAVIIVALIYLANRLIGFIALRNPIRSKEISESLTLFKQRLRQLAIVSIVTTTLFLTTVTLFFISNIELTISKYIGLSIIFISILLSIYFSQKTWKSRISSINNILKGFDEKEVSQSHT